MRARRRRSPPSSPPRRRSRPSRSSCAPASTAFPGIAHEWQQILVFVSIASMALGAFAAIGQRNIKRLMAYSSIGHMGFALVGLAAGTRARRAGRADLHEHLRGDDARHLRRDPGDAPRRQAGREHQRSRRPRAHPSDHGVLPGDAVVLARRHSAARRLLRQVLRVPRRHQCRALCAGGDRRADQRGGRLLLSGDRQDHVFRRAGAGFQRMPVLAAASCWRWPGCSTCSSSPIRRRSWARRPRRRSRCSKKGAPRADKTR